MPVELTPEQEALVKALLEASEPLEVRELASSLGLDQSKVAASVTRWETSGWVMLSETTRVELAPGAEHEELARSGLPERRLLQALGSRDQVPMKEVSALASSLGLKAGDVLKHGGRKGWFRIDKGSLTLERGEEAGPDEDEKALALVETGKTCYLDELESQGVDTARLTEILKNRGSLAKLKERTYRHASLTAAGREQLSGATTLEARSQLTSEEIVSGAWRDIRLRPFDVTLEAEQVSPVKVHPLRKIIEETRTAFLELGFTEIVSPQVESAFWNFDALFQPQDHPAREMQDTFYLEQPGRAELPEAESVERVRLTHEDGWQTGSKGWGYTWSETAARATVLRTHTTSGTIRALAAHPRPPLKVFHVGKNYRNEAISYKHLPEFHQVDGIIIDESASFASLLGTLREFYRKLGFDKVRFKPSFFPYTEPSAEVYGYLPAVDEWIELGGSGVFRPEVTEPFGCKHPVLAWGLGLERLAMLRYGAEDIRNLYWSDLDWLRGVRLCR